MCTLWMALHLYVTRSNGHVYMYMVHTQDTDQYHLNTYCSHWGFRIYNTLHHKYARHYYRARIIYWKRVWTRTREKERARENERSSECPDIYTQTANDRYRPRRHIDLGIVIHKFMVETITPSLPASLQYYFQYYSLCKSSGQPNKNLRMYPRRDATAATAANDD